MFYSIIVIFISLLFVLFSIIRVAVNRRKTHFIKNELQTILDALEPVALIDPNYNILRVNQLYASIVGKSYKQLLGKKCYEAHFNRKTPCPGCQLYKAVVEKKPQLMAASQWNIGKHKVWYDVSFTPVFDRDKKVKYVVETKKDITALHKIKTALEEQKLILEHKARELADKNHQLSLAYDQLETALAEKDHDLEMARDIQQSLLPNLPATYGHLHFWENYEPIQHIGGDLYDLIPLGNQKIGVFIGDVSGHGLAAAFVAAMVKLSLYNHIEKYYDPQRFFKDINQDLKNHLRTGLYLTAFWGVIDLKTNKIKYVRGSHPPPVIIGRDNSMRQLDSKGMLIGMLPDPFFDVEVEQLYPGDKLLFFTDGCFNIEKKDRSGFLSYADFIGILHNLGSLPLDSIYGALNLRLKTDTTLSKVDDDRTFVGIEVLKKPLNERYKYLLHFPKAKGICRCRVANRNDFELLLNKIQSKMKKNEYSERNYSSIENGVKEVLESALVQFEKEKVNIKLNIAWTVNPDLFCLSCTSTVPFCEVSNGKTGVCKGIFLLRTYMDEVYAEESGTSVTIIKRNSPSIV